LARNGAPIRLYSRKCLALLAYLAVTGVSHRRETLTALFWPESDERRAGIALRSSLSRLRASLDGEWLLADRETAGLDGSQNPAVDVMRFRNLLARCQTHGHGMRETCSQCLPLLAEVAQLHQGHFMAGFTLRDSPEFDDWQSVEARALQRELASALERLAEGYAAQGDLEQALTYAQRWETLEPLSRFSTPIENQLQ